MAKYKLNPELPTKNEVEEMLIASVRKNVAARRSQPVSAGDVMVAIDRVVMAGIAVGIGSEATYRVLAELLEVRGG
jgi:hypothetical protein